MTLTLKTTKKLDLHLKEGALTETVLRKYGEAGFTKEKKKGKKPKIKINVLKELAKSNSKITRSRARFALNARGWGKKNKAGDKLLKELAKSNSKITRNRARLLKELAKSNSKITGLEK